jgi:hypothetical protein
MPPFCPELRLRIQEKLLFIQSRPDIHGNQTPLQDNKLSILQATNRFAENLPKSFPLVLCLLVRPFGGRYFWFHAPRERALGHKVWVKCFPEQRNTNPVPSGEVYYSVNETMNLFFWNLSEVSFLKCHVSCWHSYLQHPARPGASFSFCGFLVSWSGCTWCPRDRLSSSKSLT